MTRTDPLIAIRAAALDITVASIHIDSAWTALATAQAGFPTSTPGAADAGTATVELTCDQCGNPQPCRTHRLHLTTDTTPDATDRAAGRTHELGHLSTSKTSLTESNALKGDRARQTRDEIRKRAARLAGDARWLAKHTMVWGTVNINETEVTRRIDEVEEGLWCVNCLKHNMRNVRSPGGGIRCEFCQEYRDRWKDDPSKRIFDCKQSRGGKLYENDIIRIRAEEKREADERKKADKARAQADRRADKKAS